MYYVLLSATKWRDALQRQAFLVSRRRLESGDGSGVLDRRRRILVLVNPKSGPGKAGKIFERVLGPTLRQADIPYDLVMTRRGNHAHDLVAQEDLRFGVCTYKEITTMCTFKHVINFRRWSAIVVLSGDGLLYEVYQGIFRYE